MKQFELYREYSRDALLDFVGSNQRQSGIIWGPRAPECVIVTAGGRHGSRVGYNDGPNSDGSWAYFGQGEKGNQDPSSYANRLLVEGQRTVLLFSTREPTTNEVKARGNYSKLYRYEGAFGVAAWDIFIPSNGKRKGNELLRFLLVPVVSGGVKSIVTGVKVSVSHQDKWNDLRQLLKVRGSRPEKGVLLSAEYYIRSSQVKAYARWRAEGSCEYCHSPAPFTGIDGEPFLEVHHLFRLVDDGPDSPENVAALCPNCHRRVHYGADTHDVNHELRKCIIEKEKILDSDVWG